MREWARSRSGFTCGACTAIFPSGSPCLRITLPGLKGALHVRDRCVSCAGEPAPADLPDQAQPPRALTLTYTDEDGLERPVPTGRDLTPLRREASLFTDFKQKAAGE